MEFSDRKTKFKKFRKTDQDGEPLSEEFFALITDEVTEEGTPLNAENLNKGNWRDDDTISFASQKSANTVVYPKENTTKIYTGDDGETWIVPPAQKRKFYKLSTGYDLLKDLRDPTTGQKSTPQKALNNTLDIFTQACTLNGYDNMNLSMHEYDGRSTKASDYDICGKLVFACGYSALSNYGIFDLRDPTTGQKNSLQGILNSLFSIMTQPFTMDEYDAISDLSVYTYDTETEITVSAFDMRGKSLLNHFLT